VNLEAISASLPNLAAWENVDAYEPYVGPTTFIGGSKSHYIQDEHHEAIIAAFPEANIRMVAAGHWVHAENPKLFHELAVQHFTCLK